MIVTLRDGTSIEIVGSGNGNAPDRQFGQHTNVSTTWWRHGDGPWHHCGSRATHRTVMMAEMSVNLSEFKALLDAF